MNSHISPIREPRGNVSHFVSLQQDTTGQREIEEQLLERERRLGQIADNISEIFFVMEAQFRETLFINTAYEKIWGVSCRSLYEDPMSFANPVPPEDRDRLLQNLAEAQLGRDPGEVAFRVIRPDGEIRHVVSHFVPIRNERGEVDRIDGVAMDVTDRKWAEAELRESEHGLRTLFETVNLIVLGRDAGGRVDYANPFLLRLT